ncbi:MAG: histidine--tRNA ligase [Acidimicrobiia bacterium]|nr:histidine--tRNA ligase [Acidimicrobiia bacterium]MDH3397108.1 histidine--tRNA ligase [Acidimicrobiia bacterium]MDH5615185.1 histidine--tRNA ligase [Acidimicrobiia bacterium]
MTFRAPKGTDDILPPVSRTWRRLLLTWEDWAARYGYELVLTPLFEATEVFARGTGEGTEVVQKQMYTFEDKGGRSLTLRPEGTPSVVRAFLEAGADGILKAAYWGPMFRYERPQAGRRRQFYQIDVEYLGSREAAADAEVIELGYRYLIDASVPGLSVQINSIGDRECRPAYLEVLKEYLESRRDVLCDDSLLRLTTNPMRVLDCKICAPKLSDAPSPVDYLCDACTTHYGEVRSILRELGVPFEATPRLVRGLDYYERTAFEYVATDLKAAQNAVGGGGRYDGLAELLGGRPVPGVGFALGLDRIVLTLGDVEEPNPLDLYIIVTAGRRREALRFTSELRRSGIRADLDVESRSVKAQFRAADRRGAAGALVIGDEWSEGRVVAKDLASGHQEIIRIEEVEAWTRRL